MGLVGVSCALGMCMSGGTDSPGLFHQSGASPTREPQHTDGWGRTAALRDIRVCACHIKSQNLQGQDPRLIWVCGPGSITHLSGHHRCSFFMVITCLGISGAGEGRDSDGNIQGRGGERFRWDGATWTRESCRGNSGGVTHRRNDSSQMPGTSAPCPPNTGEPS